MNEISEVVDKEIEAVILRITFQGAFQRANVYNVNCKENKKTEFRKHLSKKLKMVLDNILNSGKYDDESHYETIKTFAKEVSNDEISIDVLDKNRLRIGVAQKLINLYWKYSWLLKKTKEPIHCPFDSILIYNIFKYKGKINWTEFDEKDDNGKDIYPQLVQMAKDYNLKYSSIAEMELIEYQNYIANI